jgi:hypothetical protein
MKRRRRLFTAWRMQIVAAMAYGGEVIPPQSTVRAKQSATATYGTNAFRVGYYGRQDGLNCVWLVNSKGIYESTTTQRGISKDFEILNRSTETDLYGDNKPQLQPLTVIA